MLLSFALGLLAAPPKLDHRWVYMTTNLQVAANADRVCGIIKEAHDAGYNGMVIADSKMQRLGDVPDYYFTNTKKLIAAAKANDIELIPCIWPVGYASAMLWHDVNLVEGLPVKNAVFVVHGREASPELGQTNILPNANLESGSADRLIGLAFQDGPGKSTFFDRSEKHEGQQSIRMEQFTADNEAGNARLCWSLKVQPYHQYVFSGWSKRSGLKGLVQAIALDSKGRDLIVNDQPGGSDQDWTEFKCSFNSLESDEIKIYAGVWGGSAGKIWWDDLAVRDAGLLNVIRRPGCPIRVIAADGTVLREGIDYEPIKDPGLGASPWAGEYDAVHAAPVIRLTTGSIARDGDRLKVSYHAAKTGIGNQSSICLSEPKTQAIMEDEAKRVIELYHPKGLFWSHDEIRIGGWCVLCAGSGKTPGQILAQNARVCGAIQQKLLPGSTAYVWSDMFDPTHNAHDGYYLNNGTLAGSWEGLPKDAVIVNWNSGAASKSLPFFAGRGHQQILAGFYDAPVGTIKSWLDEAVKVKGVTGVMYTTWVGDYSKLKEFAKAAGF